MTIADVSLSYKDSNYFSPVSTNGVGNNNVGYLERTDCLTAGIASDYWHVSTFSTNNTNNLGKRHVAYRGRILRVDELRDSTRVIAGDGRTVEQTQREPRTHKTRATLRRTTSNCSSRALSTA